MVLESKSCLYKTIKASLGLSASKSSLPNHLMQAYFVFLKSIRFNNLKSCLQSVFCSNPMFLRAGVCPSNENSLCGRKNKTIMKRVDEHSMIRGPVGNCEPKKEKNAFPEASKCSQHTCYTKVVMHPLSK